MVHSPAELHERPKHIKGIYIDARGVTTPKENSKVTYDYEQGYEVQEDKNNISKGALARSFATGGAPPQRTTSSKTS